MNAAVSPTTPTGRPAPGAGWPASLAIYTAFSAAIFLIQGARPLLGSDHLSYIALADSILASCPQGDYWREASSAQNYGVLLAYLHAWTGDHILTMKLVLAAFSVAYLLAAELFFRLFTPQPWRAVLFALLSAFAVSFGVASWGVTDSTALLPRTLIAPLVIFCAWWWLRFDGRPAKYLVFPFLVLGSLLHLSAFYVIAILMLVELFDVLLLRRRFDRQVLAFVGGLAAAGVLLFALEYANVSTKVIGVQVPDMLRQAGYKLENFDQRPTQTCVKPPAPAVVAAATATAPKAPASATTSKPGPTASAKPAAPAAAKPAAAQTAAARPPTPAQAWAIELSMRPWRNMPLPLVNVANVFSSSALILALAVAGIVAAARAGFTRADTLMAAMFAAVPVFALGPQTALWALRTFFPVYPINIEEIRTLGWIMIPAMYFVLRLFERVVAAGEARVHVKAAAIVLGVLALPLLMKGLPLWVREAILSTMEALHVVDPANESRLANARAALGLTGAAAPLYYSTQGVRDWLGRNAPDGARILTDRDDLILLRGKTIVGPRQVGVTAYSTTQEQADLFLRTAQAMAARDTARVTELANAFDADFAVVPWRVEGAAYSDATFSVIRCEAGR